MIKNELLKIEENEIKSLIFEIRDKQVILDSDVAKLYNYETKKLNQTIKRNIDRFPEEFCFKITKEECVFLKSQIMTSKSNFSMRSQIVTASNNKRNIRYMPYVFTEKGIIMLASLLKSEIAIKVSIRIVEIFVEMRKFLYNNKDIFKRLTTVEYKLLEQDEKIDKIFDLLQNKEIPTEKIFYNGEIYNAYSLLVDIIKSAEKEIIIIDNYIDKTILDLLLKKNENVNVIIISNNNNKILNLDVLKFNEQYPSLRLKYSNNYHDRFIIIDSTIYHCGASLKDLGKKCFAITKMEDKTLLSKINIE